MDKNSSMFIKKTLEMWKMHFRFSFACVRVMCCDGHKLRVSTQMESKGRGVFLSAVCSPWADPTGSKEGGKHLGMFAMLCNSSSTRGHSPAPWCAQTKPHLLWQGWAQRTPCMDQPDPEELPEQSHGCSSSSAAPQCTAAHCSPLSS